jgi:hypothetical protein
VRVVQRKDVLPNTVELSETGRADEEVDGREGVVDRGDDERVSDPDEAGSGKGCCGMRRGGDVRARQGEQRQA